MIDAAELRRLVEAYEADHYCYDAKYGLVSFLLSHASELLALVEADGWRTMESAPVCESFLATCRVNNTKGDQWWETYIIRVDDETGEIDTDIDQPWSLEDYEFWRPLPKEPAQ